MRSTLLLAGLLAAVAFPAAAAQTDSTATPSAPPGPVRATTTVPLPNGSGVFYYRAGTPGGVRIRSRNGTPRPSEDAPAETAAVPGAVPGAPASRLAAVQAAPNAAVTRLDLLLLERDLLDAIDRRLANLDTGRRRDADPLRLPGAASPIVVLPGTTPRTADPGALASPTTDVPDVRDRPGSITVEEVERAILDTGLFRTSSIYFEFAKADLLPVSQRSIDAIATVLLRYPELEIEIGGHTDNVGSDATNERLSRRRAVSVADDLVRAGVEARRLIAVGYGEREPVASNTSETGRALNRRVEFVVLNPEAAERVRRRVTVQEGFDGDEASPAENDLRQIIRDEIERLRQPAGDGQRP